MRTEKVYVSLMSHALSCQCLYCLHFVTYLPKGRGFEPHRRHCVVSLSKNINPSLVLVQPRKTRPFITVRLLMGRKESNQTNLSVLVSLNDSANTH